MVAEEGLTLLRLVIYTAATEINLSFIKRLHLIWLLNLTFSHKSFQEWLKMYQEMTRGKFVLIFKKINMLKDNSSNFLYVNDYLKVLINYCSAFFDAGK